MSFVISRTSLNRGSLNRGSTVLNDKEDKGVSSRGIVD